MKINNPHTSYIFAAGGLALLLAQIAYADSANTITFKGEVTEQTCEVTVNGVNARPVVLLPSVAKSDLAAAASSAGLTTFTLGVTGCTVDSNALDIKTVFVANNMTERGNLANTGTAQNVELQLLTDSAGTTPIDLRTGTQLQESPLRPEIRPVSTTLPCSILARTVEQPPGQLSALCNTPFPICKRDLRDERIGYWFSWNDDVLLRAGKHSDDRQPDNLSGRQPGSQCAIN